MLSRSPSRACCRVPEIDMKLRTPSSRHPPDQRVDSTVDGRVAGIVRGLARFEKKLSRPMVPECRRQLEQVFRSSRLFFTIIFSARHFLRPSYRSFLSLTHQRPGHIDGGLFTGSFSVRLDSSHPRSSLEWRGRQPWKPLACFFCYVVYP